MSRLRRALSENRVETSPEHTDSRLRGRTYAISYERVWSAALALATELPRWTVLRADDQQGEIEAEARTRVFRFVDDVSIRVRLDPQGQTRVDLTSASRVGTADFGVNARRIGHFVRALDRHLQATPAVILAGD